MAAAGLVGCSFCLDLGYFMAHNEGLDEAKAREVPRWRESDAFTPLERRRHGVRRGDEPDPADRHRRDVGRAARGAGGAGAGGADRQDRVDELSARTNIALGIHSQGFSAACGLPPLATRSAAVVSSA